MMYQLSVPRHTSTTVSRGSLRCGVVARAATLSDVKARSGVAAQSPADATPQRLRTLDELPYEPGIPFIGVVLSVNHYFPLTGLIDVIFDNIIHAISPSYEMEDLFERHGDAFNMNMGPMGGWALAVHTPEHMNECLVNQAKYMIPKWPAGVESLALPLGRSSTNEETRPWRVAIGEVLSQRTIAKLELPLMASEYSAAIKKYADSGEEVQWWYVSKRLAFSVAMRAALGDVLSKHDMDELFPHAIAMNSGIFAADFGLKGGLPFTTYRRAVNGRKAVMELLSARIEAIVQDREKLDRGDCQLKRTLQALETEGIDTSADAKELSSRLAREVLQLMFAGTDTSSLTLSNAMKYLAKHPEWMTALAEEQRRLIQEHGPEITQKVVSRSSVALAIVQEVIRLHPPVMVQFRLTTKDLVIDDMAVPEGTLIVLCPKKAVRETGSGGFGFKPEHWLSEDRKKCTINNEPGNVSFGKGPRVCVGKNLSIIELVTALAVLAREVRGIEMSQKEMDRELFLTGDHPTGLPLRLVA